VGRAELLAWINGLLGINYNKVEDVANGAAFCQIIDAIHPGTVALGRVNFNAVTEPEMIENYKVLQDSFQKNGITQYVDVATLCKGKYMAALELFQWIHGYFEQMGRSMGYDGPGRRRQAKCRDPTERGRPVAKPAGMAKRQAGVPLQPPVRSPRESVASLHAKAPPKSKPPKSDREPAPIKQAKAAKPPDHSETSEKHPAKRTENLEQEAGQLSQERDFYYSKLRRIEDYCQENEDEPVVQQILEILYETDEAHGFLPPEDEE
jgi:RP/EB family microtubule-associated protein